MSDEDKFYKLLKESSAKTFELFDKEENRHSEWTVDAIVFMRVAQALIRDRPQKIAGANWITVFNKMNENSEK